MGSLYWASCEIVKLLVDNGADTNAKDNDGNTPLTWALENGNLQTIDLLKTVGAK